jgi:predicted ATPase/DNA-binding winged helix-turn-helix (wHTH) protein
MRLQVKLFGPFEVWQEGQKIEVWPRQKNQELLKLLLAERGRVFSQDQLIEALFADLDPEKATNNVQKRISELRRVLEPALRRGADSRFIIQAKGRDLGYFFSKDACCETDLSEFERELESAVKAEQAERWAQAIEHYKKAMELYRGEFLSDSLYEEWTIAPRERWREKYVNALTQLAEAHARLGQLSQAIEICEKILQHEPWNERIFRQKMLYLYHSANRAKALETYQSCREMLKKHLGAKPSPETVELHEQILKFQVPPLSRAIPNNLPQALTSFIGRTRELVELEKLLDETRFITLTGVGGCGKTRLGLQIASDLLKRYEDGVWWVELASLSDPNLIAQAIASVLGVQEQPKKTLLMTVSEYLHAKQALVVLDNCEHLLEASAAVVQELLKSAPKIQIMATSREPFGILGETLYQVPTLSIPKESEEFIEIATLRAFEALHLFEERARANDAKFSLSSENATAVTRICRRLDGIPLAIELAAARVRALSVQQIAARLDDRFRLLTGGNRAALPRHQTLEATMDWSYQLLTEKEQVLLRRLSVFAGGWTLEAAEQVCNGETFIAQEIWELLTHLVDKSLVIAEKNPEETRYKMLETVKQYAFEKLKNLSELERVQESHLDFFLKLAEEAEPELVGPKQKEWLDKLEREHENLREAITSVVTKYDERKTKLLLMTGRFWEVRGYWSECIDMLRKALERGRDLSEEYQSNALSFLGWLTHNQGDNEQAKEMLKKSIDISTRIEEKIPLAHVLFRFGTILTRQGDHMAAQSLFEQSLKIVKEFGDKRGIGAALNGLALIADKKGDYTTSEALFQQSLKNLKDIGDQRGIGSAFNNLASIAYKQNNYSLAQSYLEQGLEIMQHLGDKRIVGALLNNLGAIADKQNNYIQAILYYNQSLEVMRKLESKPGIAGALNNLGVIEKKQGNYVKAGAYYEQSLEMMKKIGDKRGIAGTLNNLGVIALEKGVFKKAWDYLKMSLEVRKELKDKRDLEESIREFSILASTIGKHEYAATLKGISENLRQALNTPIPPSDRPDYDRTISSLRASLGDEAFEKYWAEGRAMTMEQAIEYALSAELEEAANNASISTSKQ